MGKSRPRLNRSQPARQPRKPTPESASNPANDPKWPEMSENVREIEKFKLTFRQQSAMPIVAASPTMARAARASGVDERTLRRWLDDEDFRNELTRLRQESANLARLELQGLMSRGVSVVAEAMDDPDVAVRLRAARYALSFAAQFCEAEKLRSEIQALEEALPIWAAHHSLKKQTPGGNPD